MKKIIAVLIVSFFLFLGCSAEERRCPDAKFELGEIVILKLTKEKGMVIDKYRGFDECMRYYKVRIVVNEIVTDTKILDNDGPIKRRTLDTIQVAEFELEKEK